jgi:hypothetical protein
MFFHVFVAGGKGGGDNPQKIQAQCPAIDFFMLVGGSDYCTTLNRIYKGYLESKDTKTRKYL